MIAHNCLTCSLRTKQSHTSSLKQSFHSCSVFGEAPLSSFKNLSYVCTFCDLVIWGYTMGHQAFISLIFICWWVAEAWSWFARKSISLWNSSHRMLWVEATVKGYVVQPSFNKQGGFQLGQVAQSPVQPGAGCFQGWDIHHLSGKPVPVFHHRHQEKKKFPNT